MLGRFDPFAELSRLQDGLARVASATRQGGGQAMFSPAVDIWEGKESIVVKAELPGVRPEEVQISVENDLLTISGERRFDRDEGEEGWRRVESTYGSFTRTFALPKTVAVDAIDAKLENGVLTLRLPKRAEARPRKIEVKVGENKEPKTIQASAASSTNQESRSQESRQSSH
jgi:HSP20 family protein